MSFWNSITGIVKDPPPAFAFELSAAGLATAKGARPPQIGFQPLGADVLDVSPLHDNVVRPEVLAQQIREFAGGQGRKQREAVLILPDRSVLVSVVDFDSFPSDGAEQLSLVRFRIKKSVPFDVESAAVSYCAQPSPRGGKKFDVVVAVAPLEIVGHYEAPFRACGFHTGFVTTSTLAALELVQPSGISVLAKLSGRVLTISVLQASVLRLMRCVELGEATPAELMTYLYPTFAYTEDQLGALPQKLWLCGFGALNGGAEELAGELGVPVEPVRSRLGEPGEHNAGLLGYLESRGEG